MRDVLHQVIKASPIGDSTVAVTFENGICGTYDCAYLMEDPYLERMWFHTVLLSVDLRLLQHLKNLLKKVLLSGKEAAEVHFMSVRTVNKNQIFSAFRNSSSRFSLFTKDS